MKAPRKLLRNCLRNDVSPYFIIQKDEAKNYEVVKIPLGENPMTDMCLRGSFKLSRKHVFVSKKLATTQSPSACRRTHTCIWPTLSYPSADLDAG